MSEATDSKEPSSSSVESETDGLTEDSKGPSSLPAEEEKKEEKLTSDAEDAADESMKETYENWPMKSISEPHDNDVLFGRGGGTNHHPGNKRYRKMVEDKKVDYVNSKRLDKPLVALEIIKIWREQKPPGRFLKLDEKTGLWNDVGDKKAREKTSQALREKAPQIRKQQEEERTYQDSSDGEQSKTTRFAEGTKEESNNNVKKPGLARDTSLGPLAAETVVALDGFSWQEGIEQSRNSSSLNAVEPGPTRTAPSAQPPPFATNPYPGPPAHHYSYSSHGSIGSMGPPALTSGSYTPPSAEDRRMQFMSSSGRFESWSSLPPQMVPPPPMPTVHLQSSGSWGPPEIGMSSREHIQSGTSWGVPERDISQRQHSLGQFPLPHASVGHPAPFSAFDSMPGSYGHPYPGHPPPPPYGPPSYQHYSGTAPPPLSPPGYPPPSMHVYGTHSPIPAHGYTTHSAHMRTPSNPLTIDPAVASAWSGRPQAEIVKTLSEEEFEQPAVSPSLSAPSLSSKPDVIKRHTSNQNETIETKPDRHGASVKRAALNRDSSRASNRLKELCFPGQFQNGKFDVAKEVMELSEDMGRSRLSGDHQLWPNTIAEDDSTGAGPRPHRLGSDDRTSTLDLMAMDLAVKPKPMGISSRSTTIEGLDLDGLNDELVPAHMERSTTMDFVLAELQKPGVIGRNDRLTTSDFLQIVNEPLEDDDDDLPG